MKAFVGLMTSNGQKAGRALEVLNSEQRHSALESLGLAPGREERETKGCPKFSYPREESKPSSAAQRAPGFLPNSEGPDPHSRALGAPET